MSNTVQATSAKEWKNKRQAGTGPLDLPSGNTALVRPLDPTVFLDAEVMPNPLLNIVRKAIQDTQGLPPTTMKKISEDPEMLAATLQLFDRVLTRVVIEPSIQMPPPCRVCQEYFNVPIHQEPTTDGHHAYREGERDEDVLYADQVDMEDKVFIFQWCLGGTNDLQKFRAEQASTLGDLPGKQNVPNKAKRSARSK